VTGRPQQARVQRDGASDVEPAKESVMSDQHETDGVGEPNPGARGGAGESGGGAYPNPHSGKDDHPGDGFLGHGGQTDIAYHGPEQLGDDQVGQDQNPNAATKDD
jgi:hypothetical protein